MARILQHRARACQMHSMNFIESNIIRINLRQSHFSHLIKEISFYHDHGTDFTNGFWKDEFMKMIFAASRGFRDKARFMQREHQIHYRGHGRESESEALIPSISSHPRQQQRTRVKAVLAHPLHFTQTHLAYQLCDIFIRSHSL